jgi:hypothetical protein
MKSELSAMWRPRHTLRPKPYETFGAGRARRNFPSGIEMPRRVKTRCILTIDLGVTIHLPYVWDTNRAFGDEHPVVPVILG